MNKNKKQTNKTIEKLLKREKNIAIILIILIIVVFVIDRIVLLNVNYKLVKNVPNYNFLIGVKYIEEKKELKFNECIDCEYIQINEISIPTKINDYILITDKKELKENKYLMYQNEAEKKIIIDIASWEKGTRELEYKNFIRVYKETMETDNKIKYNGQPSIYEMHKRMISFRDKNLKGNFFDSNRELNEKTTMALLMIFTVPIDLNSITLYNYNKTNDIIEYKIISSSKNDNEKVIRLIYYFATETNEYKVDIIGNELKANETYINYLKVKK